MRRLRRLQLRFSDRILRLLERVEHRVAKNPGRTRGRVSVAVRSLSKKWVIGVRRRRPVVRRATTTPQRLYLPYIPRRRDGRTVTGQRSLGRDRRPCRRRAFTPISSRPASSAGRKVVGNHSSAARLEARRCFRNCLISPCVPAIWPSTTSTPTSPSRRHGRRTGLLSPRVSIHPVVRAARLSNVPAKIWCMAMDFHDVRDRVEERYPFFRSTRTNAKRCSAA